METRTPRTRFECPICGHTTMSRDSMREHVKAKHYILDFELYDGTIKVEIVDSHGEIRTKGLGD